MSDPNVVIAEEVATCNATPFNGSEQCDCIAYRLTPHRKNKCTLKRHLRPAVAGTAVAADEMVLASVCTSSSKKDTITKDNTSTASDSGSENEQQDELGNVKGAENEEDEQNQQNEQGDEQNEQSDSKEDVWDESVERTHSSQDEPGDNSDWFQQNHYPPETELPDGESQKEGGVPLFEDSIGSTENYDQSELSPKEQRLRERAERAARLHAERKQQHEYERQMRAGNEKEPDNEPAIEP
uniref:Uncharacterized protein n=1 Tax=Spumella elongata TaxID=89044 RepID=A0A7S3M9X5_9STRA